MMTLYAILCLLMCVVYVPMVRTDPVSQVKHAVKGCFKQKWAGSANGFGCPLRNRHQRAPPYSDDAAADRDLSTMMATVRDLRQQGYSVAELENDNVMAEFQRLLKNLPLCPKSPARCNPSETFRSINGTCNNLYNPTWGMSGAAELRLLPAAYDDGLNLPRSRGIDGKSLPFARTVSNAVHMGPQQLKSPTLTLQAFQFGQFLDHDIIQTPLSTAVDDCCADNDESLGTCIQVPFTLVSSKPMPGKFILRDPIGDVLTGEAVVIGFEPNVYFILWGCTKPSVIANQCADPWLEIMTREQFPLPAVWKNIDMLLMNVFGMRLAEFPHVPQTNAPCVSSTPHGFKG